MTEHRRYLVVFIAAIVTIILTVAVAAVSDLGAAAWVLAIGTATCLVASQLGRRH
jgi:cell division protein FtsW (lipid II flippase)